MIADLKNYIIIRYIVFKTILMIHLQDNILKT